jgi:hypothetical protein
VGQRITSSRCLDARVGRPLTSPSAAIANVTGEVMHATVAAVPEVAIARCLIAIGCSLIVLGRDLIAVGRGLLAVRPRLVSISEGLIPISERLIVLERPRTDDAPLPPNRPIRGIHRTVA